jgi:hypothetical protein
MDTLWVEVGVLYSMLHPKGYFFGPKLPSPLTGEGEGGGE